MYNIYIVDYMHKRTNPLIRLLLPQDGGLVEEVGHRQLAHLAGDVGQVDWCVGCGVVYCLFIDVNHRPLGTF